MSKINITLESGQGFPITVKEQTIFQPDEVSAMSGLSVESEFEEVRDGEDLRIEFEGGGVAVLKGFYALDESDRPEVTDSSGAPDAPADAPPTVTVDEGALDPSQIGIKYRDAGDEPVVYQKVTGNIVFTQEQVESLEVLERNDALTIEERAGNDLILHFPNGFTVTLQNYYIASQVPEILEIGEYVPDLAEAPLDNPVEYLEGDDFGVEELDFFSLGDLDVEEVVGDEANVVPLPAIVPPVPIESAGESVENTGLFGVLDGNQEDGGGVRPGAPALVGESAEIDGENNKPFLSLFQNETIGGKFNLSEDADGGKRELIRDPLVNPVVDPTDPTNPANFQNPSPELSGETQVEAAAETPFVKPADPVGVGDRDHPGLNQAKAQFQSLSLSLVSTDENFLNALDVGDGGVPTPPGAFGTAAAAAYDGVAGDGRLSERERVDSAAVMDTPYKGFEFLLLETDTGPLKISLYGAPDVGVAPPPVFGDADYIHYLEGGANAVTVTIGGVDVVVELHTNGALGGVEEVSSSKTGFNQGHVADAFIERSVVFYRPDANANGRLTVSGNPDESLDQATVESILSGISYSVETTNTSGDDIGAVDVASGDKSGTRVFQLVAVDNVVGNEGTDNSVSEPIYFKVTTQDTPFLNLDTSDDVTEAQMYLDKAGNPTSFDVLITEDVNVAGDGNSFATDFEERSDPIQDSDEVTDVLEPVNIVDASSGTGQLLLDSDSDSFLSVNFAITDVLDGNSEQLEIGGTAFLLATDDGTVDAGVYEVTHAGDGVFTVTADGGAPLTEAQVETLLSTTTYAHLSDDPQEGVRTITFTVTDEDGLVSNTVTSSITVNAYNDRPRVETFDYNTEEAGLVIFEKPDLDGADDTALEDSVLEIDILDHAAIFEPDGADTHTFEIRDGSATDLDGAPINDRDDVQLSGHADSVTSSIAGFDQGTDVEVRVLDASAGTFSLSATEFNNLGFGETATVTFTYAVRDSSGVGAENPLPDHETDLSAFETVTVTITGTNDTPEVTSMNHSGVISETADNAPAPDDAPMDATGTIQFTEEDLNDTHVVSSSTGTIQNANFANSYTLTAAQITAITQQLSLSGVTFDAVNGTGSFDWTYSLPNSAIDFFGENDSVEIAYTVTLDDQSGAGTPAALPQENATTTSTVIITINGTNDAPIIDSAAQADTVTETVDAVAADADPTQGSGTVTFDDVDLSDNPTASTSASGTITSSTLANGYALTAAQTTALTEALTLSAVTFSAATGAGSVDWTTSYTNADIDFLGEDDSVEVTHTITIDDANGGTDTQNVVVTINGTNDAPIIDSAAQADTVTETVDAVAADADPTQGSGTVTFDDVDLSDNPTASTSASGTITSSTLANGYALTAAQTTALTEALTLSAVTFSAATGAGSVDWTTSYTNADIDFLGENDSVEVTHTITIDDANGGTDTQNVVVTINGTNDAPIIDSAAQADTVTETVDAVAADADPTQGSGSVTFDDVDLSDNPTASTSASGTITSSTLANGYALTAAQTTALTEALTLSAVTFSAATGAGSVDWTTSYTNADIDFLGENDSVEVTHTITIDDANGGTDTQNVVVTINGTNDAPIIDSAAQADTVTETVDAVAADADPTQGSGSVTFDDVDLSDNPTASTSASGTITSSTLANGYALTAAQTTALTEALTLSAVTFSAATGAGSVDWTTSYTNADIDFLGENDSVEVTHTITIDDANGGTDTQNVVVTINGTNDAPIIDSAAQADTVTETVDAVAADADPTQGSGSVTFDDVDLSDNPTASTSASGTITSSTLANGYALTAAQTTALTEALTLSAVTFSAATGAGSVDWTTSYTNADIDFLGENDSVEVTHTITIDDANGGTDTQNVVVTINGTNDAPIIDSGAQSGTVTETADSAPAADADPTQATGLVTFDDVDLSDNPMASTSASGSITALTLDGGPLTGAQTTALTEALTLTGLTFSSASGAGSVDWETSYTNADIDFLGDGESVEVTHTISINDGNGGIATQQVVVTIVGTNDDPVITSDGGGGTASVTIDEGTTAVTNVDTTDVEGDTEGGGAGSNITYTLTVVAGGGADNALFNIDADTGVLTFAAAPDFENPTDAGGDNVYDVQVTATDSDGGTDVQDIAVTVTDIAEVSFQYSYSTGSLLEGDILMESVSLVGDTLSAGQTASVDISIVDQTTDINDYGDFPAAINTAVANANFAAGTNVWAFVGSTLTYTGDGNPHVDLDFVLPITANDGAEVREFFTLSLLNPTGSAGVTALAAGNPLGATYGFNINASATPVTVDLDGDGLEFVAFDDSSAHFDIDGDGASEQVAWVSGDDGILAIDLDGDGAITQRSEIVMTDHAADAETDLEAVRLAFDSDGDSLLTAADDRWADFGIWQDANEDGISDDGEFQSLGDLGIVSLDLISNGIASTPVSGVNLSGMSTLTYADGSTAEVGDASLSYADLPAPDEVLTDGDVDVDTAVAAMNEAEGDSAEGGDDPSAEAPAPAASEGGEAPAPAPVSAVAITAADMAPVSGGADEGAVTDAPPAMVA